MRFVRIILVQKFIYIHGATCEQVYVWDHNGPIE